MSRKEVWCSKKRDGRMSVFQPEDEGYSVSEIRRGLCLLPNIFTLTNACIFILLFNNRRAIVNGTGCQRRYGIHWSGLQ